MLRNVQTLTDDDGNGTTTFQRAYLDGNIGNVKVTAGRYNNNLVDGNVYDNRVDGIKATVGKNVKLTAEYGKMSSGDFGSGSKAGKFWRATLGGDIGNVGLEANYIVAKDLANMGMSDEDKIWTVGAKYKADNWNLGATYLKGNNDTIDADPKGNQTGYVIGLGILGAKASKPGSFGFDAKYYNQGASTVIAHTMNGAYDKFSTEGFKGYQLAGYYTVAKNMVAGIQYYDLKGKENDLSAKTIWSQLMVTF